MNEPELMRLCLMDGRGVNFEITAAPGLHAVTVQTLFGRFYLQPESVRQVCERMSILLEPKP